MLSDDELKRYRELLNAQNDSTYFKKEIGANLKNARANTPLTQEDVAEIFDCDPRKIRRYENGEVMCSLTQLISFCKGDIELPNDISGIVYIQLDSNGSWKIPLAKELKLCI